MQNQGRPLMTPDMRVHLLARIDQLSHRSIVVGGGPRETGLPLVQ